VIKFSYNFYSQSCKRKLTLPAENRSHFIWILLNVHLISLSFLSFGSNDLSYFKKFLIKLWKINELYRSKMTSWVTNLLWSWTEHQTLTIQNTLIQRYSLVKHMIKYWLTFQFKYWISFFTQNEKEANIILDITVRRKLSPSSRLCLFHTIFGLYLNFKLCFLGTMKVPSGIRDLKLRNRSYYYTILQIVNLRHREVWKNFPGTILGNILSY
jgi:hypothetical protein